MASLADIDTQKPLPAHIAVIMDGNGRWAQARGYRTRLQGHRAGADSIHRMLQACEPLSAIRYITVYAFSTENWSRPPEEVKGLMGLLKKFIRDNLDEFDRKGVCLRIIGRREGLAPDVLSALDTACERTADNSRITLVVALNYGSRQELTDAMRGIARSVIEGACTPEALTEETIRAHLYAPDIPDPDLLIRTSGELRLSNFLLWQLSYTELYVTPTYWPDFKDTDLYDALVAYQSRTRRYGGRPEEEKA